MLSFQLVNTTETGEHSFACYDLQSDDDLIIEIASFVRDLYVEDLTLREELRNAAQGLGEVCDEAELSRMISEVAEAVIPQLDRDSAQPLHLQVPRNEIAEVLALYVLEHIHGFSVPTSRIKNKEVSGQPSRGLDVLGLMETSALVITEVKASSSASSPPSVVHSARDSMHSESLKRLNNRKSLIAELHWALKHAKPEAKTKVATSLLLHGQPNAPISIVAPVLVRAAETHQEADFGDFMKPSEDFGASPIKFVIVRLPSSLEDFAESVYAKALEQAA